MSDELPELGGRRGPVRHFVESIVEWSIKRPLTVILLALLMMAAARSRSDRRPHRSASQEARRQS